jgi:Ca2+-binding RTX toxin-like protein
MEISTRALAAYYSSTGSAHLRRTAIACATLALAALIVPAPASAGDLDARAAACQQRFTGGPGEDTIHGNRNDNVICGLRGNDGLFGNSGADVLRGGAGSDHINGEEGRDTVLGGPGGDNLFGGASADRVYGESGGDTLWGGRGDDRLLGGKGNDVFRPRAGIDVVRGGPGNDWIDLTHGDRFDTHDSASCGEGIDTVLIDAGGDGHGGHDTVSADCETVIEE